MRAAPAMPPPGFDELSPEEKLDYLQALWDRMATRPEEIPVPEWPRSLVRERLAAHERGEGGTVSWAEVRREVHELLRKPRK
ncbi:MAG TPA: addiction module protein [Haliangium sp.]|nr:addiction module protein [Haliangium sp.]